MRLDFLPLETAIQNLRASFIKQSAAIPDLARGIVDDVSRDLLAIGFKKLNQAFGVQQLQPGQVPHV